MSPFQTNDDDLLQAEDQPPTTARAVMECNTKTVRFPESQQLERHVVIPSLSESSPEELSTLYTTAQDHRRSMLDARDCITFVQRIASSSSGRTESFIFDQEQEDATGYCLRGLESMQSKSIIKLIALRKRLVRDTVLLEQRRSKESSRDGNDQLTHRRLEERVAAASAEASSWARDRAYERAVADAAWVEQYALLEETLAAALKVNETTPPHESPGALKKRRRRSSVTFCSATRRLSSSSFCSTFGGDDGNDPKSLAQSFRRLSSKGSSAPGTPPEFSTSPRAYAYRPAKKTTVVTNARVASSPSA